MKKVVDNRAKGAAAHPEACPGCSACIELPARPGPGDSIRIGVDDGAVVLSHVRNCGGRVEVAIGERARSHDAIDRVLLDVASESIDIARRLEFEDEPFDGVLARARKAHVDLARLITDLTACHEAIAPFVAEESPPAVIDARVHALEMVLEQTQRELATARDRIAKLELEVARRTIELCEREDRIAIVKATVEQFRTRAASLLSSTRLVAGAGDGSDLSPEEREARAGGKPA